MRKIAFVLALSLLFISCSGKTGPTGPQGPRGDSGASIIYIIGIFSSADYHGSTIWIDDLNIEEDAIVEVFASQDKDVYAYLNIADFQLTNSRIYILDAAHDYLGYDYMIKIIPNSGL
jgi:hypothetical protein